MLDEIILLTGEVEAPHLAAMLSQYNPALAINHAEDAEKLQTLCAAPTPTGGRRLIAFCTSVIVPGPVLDALGAPAYNFHPGPPEYPGAHPASFAVYENAATYGVTVHEMMTAVDAGTIVAMERFDMPPNLRFAELEMHAYKVLVALFQRMAERLACNPAPLPPSGDVWRGKASTKRDFERMREYTEDMDEDEITRRFRAFG